MRFEFECARNRRAEADSVLTRLGVRLGLAVVPCVQGTFLALGNRGPYHTHLTGGKVKSREAVSVRVRFGYRIRKP